MIISDNTERGSIKLTCCSCRKKGYETENLSAKERWNTKQNLHLSWSFLLPNLRSRVLCGLFSPRRARSCQSNHLLENPRYTLTERLLANLTHLRFVFGFFLAHKNGFESVWFSGTFHTRYRSNFKDFAAWPFSPVPDRVWVTLKRAISHAHNAHDHCTLRMKDYMGFPRNSWRGGSRICWFQENKTI